MNQLLLSENETAEYTGISLETLQYWRYSGLLHAPPFSRRVEGSITGGRICNAGSIRRLLTKAP